MAKRTVWVLDTETKGTGAQMVPLEEVVKAPDAAPPRPPFVPPKPRARTPKAPAPSIPRRFRVVDVMTREALAGDVDLRTALDVLGDVRSTVDVNLYVWEPERDDWRLLTLGEKREVWNRRRAR
jgi:hypothetical protein